MRRSTILIIPIAFLLIPILCALLHAQTVTTPGNNSSETIPLTTRGPQNALAPERVAHALVCIDGRATCIAVVSSTAPCKVTNLRDSRPIATSIAVERYEDLRETFSTTRINWTPSIPALAELQVDAIEVDPCKGTHFGHYAAPDCDCKESTPVQMQAPLPVVEHASEATPRFE